MTTSIDSNIIVALWRNTHSSNRIASKLLDQAQKRGKLVVSAPVYAELMADPNRSESELDKFASDTGISIEWTIEEDIWREAGRAYRAYAQRRIHSGGGSPKRILADFVIGAHALVRGYTLLTLNARDYVTAFPKLAVVSS
jgi:hypothetical protein